MITDHSPFPFPFFFAEPLSSLVPFALSIVHSHSSVGVFQMSCERHRITTMGLMDTLDSDTDNNANFEKLKSIASMQIKKRKYAVYRKSLATFKLNHPKAYRRHSAANVFNLKVDDMHVHLLELSLYFNQNKILLDDYKAWEKIMFDQLHIPIEDRIKVKKYNKTPRIEYVATKPNAIVQENEVEEQALVDLCAEKLPDNQFMDFVNQFQFSRAHRIIHPDFLNGDAVSPLGMVSLPSVEPDSETKQSM